MCIENVMCMDCKIKQLDKTIKALKGVKLNAFKVELENLEQWAATARPELVRLKYDETTDVEEKLDLKVTVLTLISTGHQKLEQEFNEFAFSNVANNWA